MHMSSFDANSAIITKAIIKLHVLEKGKPVIPCLKVNKKAIVIPVVYDVPHRNKTF